MFKRTLALIISVSILALGTMVCFADSYDDNNTNADNTIVDKINWLASDVCIVKLLSHINGSSKLKVEDAEFAAFDFHSNGKVTIVDLVNIKKYIVGE